MVTEFGESVRGASLRSHISALLPSIVAKTADNNTRVSLQRLYFSRYNAFDALLFTRRVVPYASYPRTTSRCWSSSCSFLCCQVCHLFSLSWPLFTFCFRPVKNQQQWKVILGRIGVLIEMIPLFGFSDKYSHPVDDEPVPGLDADVSSTTL